MKILIAEDDPPSRRLLSALVAKFGHEPLVAADGHEAWSRLRVADGPRLVLLDWMMPGMDGIEVCRRIRERGSSRYTYVVILTSKSEPADAVAALEAGADDIMTKPFHAAELRARINTAQRILKLEEDLANLALYDELTGLPNRTLLAERFRQNAEIATRNGEMLAILFIDFDGFKSINDRLGHAAGDAVLKESARRLGDCMRGTETMARFGGDEFVCLARVPDDAAADALAGRLRQALETTNDRPEESGRRRLTPQISIGVSLFPRDGRTLDALLGHADVAMYGSRRNRMHDVLRKQAHQALTVA